MAMFTASVGTLGAKGDERKKTVVRSSKAFRTHCTASRLTKNMANFGLVNLATANSPSDNTTPASSVKGTPESVPAVPAINGLINPKISVKAKIRTAEPSSTTRAATARRIRIKSNPP